MDFIQAVILGIVEGITEFLPVSSTGHLILTTNLLGIEHTEFVKSFEIMIQSGAILSVIVLFSGRMRSDFELGKRVLAAFIPTAILGFILYGFIKDHLLGNEMIVLASLFLGGFALIGIELFFKAKNKGKNADSYTTPLEGKDISYKNAVIIGSFQSIAFVPGVSRSASTIIGGMFMGLARRKATEFSFLIAVPTMIAATALDLIETDLTFTSNQAAILATGFITSFIVATIAIKWLIKYVRSNDFIPFGIYRIIVAVAYYYFIIR